MARPVNSSVTIAFKSEQANAPQELSPEELLEEQRAEEEEEELKAQAEQDAEDEELSYPLDPEDQEGWGDNIKRLNE